METFRRGLKRKTVLYIIFSGIAIVIIGTLIWFYRIKPNSMSHVSEFFGGFQTGIGGGLLLLMILKVVNNIRIMNNEAKLKEAYIMETDERDQLIKKEIGLACLQIYLFFIALASFVAGFYNQAVSVTLSAVLFFMLVTYILVRLYFQNKI